MSKAAVKMTRTGCVLLLAYLGFVGLGLPDAVIGVAWPSIRRAFGLPLDALGLLFFSGTAGYILSSFNSGRIVNRYGVGLVLAASSLLTALSLLGYVLSSSWLVIVALGFVGGLGAGAIDSGINLFAAIRFSNRHVNWLHACWGIGAASGPAIMTWVLKRGGSWRVGYLVIMGVLLVLALAYFATLRLWRLNGESEGRPEPHAPRRSTLKMPSAWLGMALFFVYCGIETSAGQWAYSLLVESRGVLPVRAGLWVSLYWGALTAGRFLVGAIANRVAPVRLMRICMGGVVAGFVLLGLRVGRGVEAVGLGVAGFSLAAIFPTLIAQTPRRFGAAHAPNMVGFQVAAAGVGIAVIPAFAGIVARHAGLEVLPGFLIVATATLFVLHEAVVRQSGG